MVLARKDAAVVENLIFMEPSRDPELLFLHEKDYWFRAIWQDLHLAATWTVSRAEIDHLSALLDVSARMLGGVRRVQACGHQLSLVSAMYTSLSPFG